MVLLVLEVHAGVAKDPQYFRQLIVFLVHNFRADNSLLERLVSPILVIGLSLSFWKEHVI